MTDEETTALFEDLSAAFDKMLGKPAVQVELQDWIDGKRDDGYRTLIAQRLAKTAFDVFTRPIQ